MQGRSVAGARGAKNDSHWSSILPEGIQEVRRRTIVQALPTQLIIRRSKTRQAQEP